MKSAVKGRWTEQGAMQAALAGIAQGVREEKQIWIV